MADTTRVANAKPLDRWARWADDVRGCVVPGGHFNPEEDPEETAGALADSFSA
ncbi:MAG: hypothetical protein ABW211_06555 [Acidimicrobiia bacterium]